ncbi:PAS domain S-box protein [Novipirellula aureliae]|nr:PAS domain S-box protein [Novipirellula aureliae]
MDRSNSKKKRTGAPRTRSADARTQQVADAIPAMVWICRSDGYADYFNQKWCEQTGKTAAESIGWGWVEVIHPDDRVRIEQNWLGVVESGDDYVNELRYRMANGEYRWHLVRAVPVRDDMENVGDWIGICTDIEDKHRSEETLRNREKHYRAVVETAGSLVIFMSPENEILEWNSEAERLIGYSRDEVLGQNPFEFLVDSRRRDNTMAEILSVHAGNSLQSFELPFRTRSGRLVSLLWNATRVLDGNGKLMGHFAVGQDISALKAAQDKLIQSERLAAMGQMMSSLAHESRNALQRIQAGVDMLKFEIAEGSEAASDLAEISKARSDLLTLLDAMRNFAAPVILDLQACNLAEVWNQAWRYLHSADGNHQAELAELTQGFELQCTVDPFRIEQVFRNLFENAIAACAGPAKIQVICADCELESVPAMRITVRDNGPGLTTEQLERTFDAFYTTKPKGTGLGMAIALKAVRAHNGMLSANNGDGGGAEFVITLPRHQEKNDVPST